MIYLSQEKFNELLGKIDQINDGLAVRKREHDSLGLRLTNLERDLSDLKIKLFGASGAMSMEQINRQISRR